MATAKLFSTLGRLSRPEKIEIIRFLADQLAREGATGELKPGYPTPYTRRLRLTRQPISCSGN